LSDGIENISFLIGCRQYDSINKIKTAPVPSFKDASA
jgi:hypothetical protein